VDDATEKLLRLTPAMPAAPRAMENPANDPELARFNRSAEELGRVRAAYQETARQNPELLEEYQRHTTNPERTVGARGRYAYYREALLAGYSAALPIFKQLKKTAQGLTRAGAGDLYDRLGLQAQEVEESCGRLKAGNQALEDFEGELVFEHAPRFAPRLPDLPFEILTVKDKDGELERLKEACENYRRCGLRYAQMADGNSQALEQYRRDLKNPDATHYALRKFPYFRQTLVETFQEAADCYRPMVEEAGACDGPMGLPANKDMQSKLGGAKLKNLVTAMKSTGGQLLEDSAELREGQRAFMVLADSKQSRRVPQFVLSAAAEPLLRKQLLNVPRFDGIHINETGADLPFFRGEQGPALKKVAQQLQDYARCWHQFEGSRRQGPEQLMSYEGELELGRSSGKYLEYVTAHRTHWDRLMKSFEDLLAARAELDAFKPSGRDTPGHGVKKLERKNKSERQNHLQAALNDMDGVIRQVREYIDNVADHHVSLQATVIQIDRESRAEQQRSLIEAGSAPVLWAAARSGVEPSQPDLVGESSGGAPLRQRSPRSTAILPKGRARGRSVSPG
jgi:hypothetical protein